jgi:hypothetical protein
MTEWNPHSKNLCPSVPHYSSKRVEIKRQRWYKQGTALSAKNSWRCLSVCFSPNFVRRNCVL